MQRNILYPPPVTVELEAKKQKPRGDTAGLTRNTETKATNTRQTNKKIKSAAAAAGCGTSSMDGFYIRPSSSQLGALSATSFLLSIITLFLLRRQRCGSIAVVAAGGDATDNAKKSTNYKRRRQLKQHNTLKIYNHQQDQARHPPRHTRPHS